MSLRKLWEEKVCAEETTRSIFPCGKTEEMLGLNKFIFYTLLLS